LLSENNRALKEWALICEAMKEGRQIVLLRKGGIREEDGVFRVEDKEFFLLPTYEHQSDKLIQEEYRPWLQQVEDSKPDPNTIQIDAYVVVDTVTQVQREEKLREIAHEFLWNDEYLRMRADFNPYDPLLLIILRAYELPESVTLPMRHEYAGCKSWVTLDSAISTSGCVAAVADEEFELRRAAIIGSLGAETLISD
jgi:hypothetical protein